MVSWHGVGVCVSRVCLVLVAEGVSLVLSVGKCEFGLDGLGWSLVKEGSVVCVECSLDDGSDMEEADGESVWGVVSRGQQRSWLAVREVVQWRMVEHLFCVDVSVCPLDRAVMESAIEFFSRRCDGEGEFLVCDGVRRAGEGTDVRFAVDRVEEGFEEWLTLACSEYVRSFRLFRDCGPGVEVYDLDCIRRGWKGMVSCIFEHEARELNVVGGGLGGWFKLK